MGLHPHKLDAAMLVIATHPRVRDLGLTKLWKLLYFADVAHAREHGSTITGSEFIKYPFGPVPSRGERHLKRLVKRNLVRISQVNAGTYRQTMVEATLPARSVVEALDRAEQETLDAVCVKFGAVTAKKLSDLSHAEPAWVAAPTMQKLSPALMLYGAFEDSDGL